MIQRTHLILAFTATLALGAALPPVFRGSVLRMGSSGEMEGALAGPLRRANSELAFAPAQVGGGLIFNGKDDAFISTGSQQGALPATQLHVGALVSVETPRRWGGIVGAVEDNGEAETGWILGYDPSAFTLMISTEATDDGDGKMITLRADRPYEFGRLHLVTASYDGERAELTMDGVVVATSDAPGGPIVYSGEERLTVGAYRDVNEMFPHDGRIAALEIFDSPFGGKLAFRKRFGAANETPWTDATFDWAVQPYLTWPSTDAVSVLGESTWPSEAVVLVRPESQADWTEVPSGTPGSRLHEVRLEGLQADTKYFYQMNLIGAADGDAVPVLEGPVRSFRTAPQSDRSAFTFTVIGDTQTNGAVAKRVSDLAFEQRPNFVVHCGDLVDTGGNKTDWTETFFPSMRPLIEHAPLVPVLGNHEQDAKLYYDYMSLPAPERWYSLRYGSAEFFMIDGNRSLAQQSEQLAWLDGALSASKAKWRFAVLHQPPYTSDSNDYGDTTLTSSTRGDMNVRNIVRLLEEHGVDICFSGHVHDYERTFPIKGGEVLPHQDGGVLYITAAGGGGSLEDFDGTNTWFGNRKARRHHHLHVAILGDDLELQAMDEDGRVFDTLRLRAR